MFGKLIVRNNPSIMIDGVVEVTNNPIGVNDFLDKFIEWIEDNGWYFGGTINGINNI